MRKKKYIMLIAALTVSCSCLFTGCSLGFLPSASSDGVDISAEGERVVDGQITLHSRWYDSDSTRLAGITVSFYDGRELIAEETTDENGNLNAVTLPGNTEITCTVTDSDGKTLAETNVIYHILEGFSGMTVYTIGEASNLQELSIAADQTELSAAIFVTDDGLISYANVCAYTEDSSNETADSSDTEETDTSSDGTTDGNTDGAAEGGTDGTTDGNTEGAAEGNTDGTTEGNTDGAAEGNTDGTTDGNTDGAAEGSADGTTEGNTDGAGN